MLNHPTSARPGAAPKAKHVSDATTVSSDIDGDGCLAPPRTAPSSRCTNWIDIADWHPGSAEGDQIQPLNAGLRTDEDGKEVNLNRYIDFLLLFRTWLFAVLLVNSVDHS
jgi:hypothetical protein